MIARKRRQGPVGQRVPRRSLGPGACLCCLLTGLAQAASGETGSETPSVLPDIRVTAPPDRLLPPFEDSMSVSQRDREDLERFQPVDLFAALADVPGVSVNGGPLLGGKKFNIRGFGDTEDVAVELDGIPRDFEKYRFGNGVFLEPALLRSVEVWRLPSVRGTPGSIGGAVRAWTRDAAGLLGEGRRLGGQVGLGYGTNNEEESYSGILAAKPSEWSGLLLAGHARSSENITLPDGSELANTATDNVSSLVKLSVAPAPGLRLALAYVGWTDSSLQAFDATAGQPGLFGNVRRDVEDQTLTLTGELDGRGNWLDLAFSLGYTATRVDDTHSADESLFANDATGTVRDRYDFDSVAFRVENLATPRLPLGRLGLRIGFDGLQSARDVRRITDNEAINAALYPGGFNPAQPSGEKTFVGGYLLPEFRWKGITLRAGLRETRYRVEADGGAAEQLRSFGEPVSQRFSETSSELGAELRGPAGLTLFYNYAEASRPPLIDEYFTQGAFSRCNAFFMGAFAPASGVCGTLYRPEEAETQEAGLSFVRRFADGARVAMKATVFESEVAHTLESISVIDGRVDQPGREERRGIELEADYDGPGFFARLSYTRIRGESTHPVDGEEPLFDLPGDQWTAMAGWRGWSGRVEAGYRVSRTDSRDVILGGGPGDFEVGRQAGYTLHGAFATLNVLEPVEIRFIGENLSNEEYRLNDGFGGGIGTAAPGRNWRVIVTAQF